MQATARSEHPGLSPHPRANATTLYGLVQKEGVLNTTVTLTGSSQIALARNPRNVARRDATPQYNAAGNPVVLMPQPTAPGQYAAPVQRPDDGYIYPADGSSDGARYPAPRSGRRIYDAQVYPSQAYPTQAYPQPQYYDNRGYAPAPQVYAPQPRGLY